MVPDTRPVLRDEQGRPHNFVGTGYPDAWARPTNRYPGCNCPAWRYNPAHPKTTNPDCEKHGEQDTAA